MDTIRVLQMGLGPIGRRVTRYLLERGGLEIVGAVDSDPALRGKRLDELADLAAEGLVSGVVVVGSVEEALAGGSADVAVVTTTSSLARLEPQLAPLIAHGLRVVSTCEELAYPWKRQPALARRIDIAAREAGVAVLGTGVNPGFLMDLLPVALSGVCQRVETVLVERVQDAQYRRLPFQKKIGAGLSPAEFDAKIREGSLRHVGLTESMHMIAAAFGWELSETEEQIEPVLAEHTVRTPDLVIEPGWATGVHQRGYGYCGQKRVIELRFVAAVGEPASYERIVLQGEPTIEMRIPGGVNGDVATGAIVVNAVCAIGRAEPGLRTMIDMPIVCYKAR